MSRKANDRNKTTSIQQQQGGGVGDWDEFSQLTISIISSNL